MSKQLKIFFIKLLVFGCVLVIVDLAAGYVLRYVFYKQKSGKYLTTSYAIHQSNEDVIIFGNSHAAQHFDAPLMRSKLNKTVFNFGNQGQGILYSYPVIKTVLSRYSPRLIILNVDYDELKYNETDRERLSILLPYFKTNAFIDSALAIMPGRQNIKAYSSLYRYNSTLGYVLLNIFKPDYNKSMASLGYDPTPGDLCSNLNVEAPPVDTAIRFDELKIRQLTNLLAFIKSKRINVLVTTTPLFNAPGDRNAYKEKLTEILKQQGIDYLDGGADTEFKGNCRLFNDPTHLNPQGAALWSAKCTRYIKELFFKDR